VHEFLSDANSVCERCGLGGVGRRPDSAPEDGATCTGDRGGHLQSPPAGASTVPRAAAAGRGVARGPRRLPRRCREPRHGALWRAFLRAFDGCSEFPARPCFGVGLPPPVRICSRPPGARPVVRSHVASVRRMFARICGNRRASRPTSCNKVSTVAVPASPVQFDISSRVGLR